MYLDTRVKNKGLHISFNPTMNDMIRLGEKGVRTEQSDEATRIWKSALSGLPTCRYLPGTFSYCIHPD